MKTPAFFLAAALFSIACAEAQTVRITEFMSEGRGLTRRRRHDQHLALLIQPHGDLLFGLPNGSVPRMAAGLEKPFTAADYRRMEDDGRRYEVLEGTLIMAPAPNRFHQAISRNLCRILYGHLHRRPIGKAYDAPFDVYLDEETVVQPDFVFVAAQSKAKLIPEGVEGAPDLVVEILSPATSARDLGVKRRLYARAGVRELWILSPETRQLQVYLPEKDATHPARILLEDESYETQLLPGLTLPVGELFED
jgi:Uma2 family endonuclease